MDHVPLVSLGRKYCTTIDGNRQVVWRRDQAQVINCTSPVPLLRHCEHVFLPRPSALGSPVQGSNSSKFHLQGFPLHCRIRHRGPSPPLTTQAPFNRTCTRLCITHHTQYTHIIQLFTPQQTNQVIASNHHVSEQPTHAKYLQHPFLCS